jgi:hypothetical protein
MRTHIDECAKRDQQRIAFLGMQLNGVECGVPKVAKLVRYTMSVSVTLLVALATAIFTLVRAAGSSPITHIVAEHLDTASCVFSRNGKKRIAPLWRPRASLATYAFVRRFCLYAA